jgi:hypothetical protein
MGDPNLLRILVSTDNHLVSAAARSVCMGRCAVRATPPTQRTACRMLFASLPQSRTPVAPPHGRHAHGSPITTAYRQGVWERDEERKHDSFNSFEEVLQLAHAHNVDMLLLGGDLFHDNKPSRTTIIRTIQLLNTYCLGDRCVRVRCDGSAGAADRRATCLSLALHVFVTPTLALLFRAFTHT